VQAGSEVCNHVAKALVDGLGREAFVAAAVEADGRMVANAKNVVVGIAKEKVVVIGIGAVDGVGEPEILPDDDAVTVRRIVEGFVAGCPTQLRIMLKCRSRW
jgi:hypothetical protein